MSGNRCLILVLFILTTWFGCSQGQSETEARIKENPTTPSIAAAFAAADTGHAGVPPESVATDASAAQAEAAPKQQKEPRIEFDRVKFDFGEIDAGEKVEHIFTFKNMGDAPLIIKKVKSG